MFEDFMEEEYQYLHGSDHKEIMDLAVQVDEALLRNMAALLHFPMNGAKASKETLADYMTHLLVQDRNYDYYEDLIQATYRDLLVNAFEAYQSKAYDAQKLQIVCYEEGFSSELSLHTGKALIEYCDDELEKLGKIYFGEHDHIHYKGTLEELPDDIQLYLKLR